MSYAATTAWVMIAATSALVAWDVYVAFFNRERGDTISRAMHRSGSAFAGLPFAWGVLGGHFWGVPVVETPWWVAALGLSALLSTAVIVHRVTRRVLVESGWLLLPWMLLGAVSGWLLWPLGATG